MQEDINKAIETLTKLITEHIDSADALRYTQAALNLAHLQVNLEDLKLRGG